MLEINANALEQRLRERFEPTLIEVRDDSAAHAGHLESTGGQGTHFHVHISSKHFVGLNQVRRHRLVYDALDDFFAAGLHALTLRTEVPAN